MKTFKMLIDWYDNLFMITINIKEERLIGADSWGVCNNASCLVVCVPIFSGFYIHSQEWI